MVGNPPDIRLEDIPDDRMAVYRHACPTMGGRADIYVGFYESPSGASAQADSWASSVRTVGCVINTVADFASW
ncbi:hypothetical protein EV190_101786 [Actinorugispora endophytica]|uniref:Uncharacterized protein n=1 Tax=Actinorugispora endophytica TaxID=1605990 RepID=A0A4R6V8I8_9ACTN|nr:hypothetical protein EV190_101786 [Actinorugispora endophytica]